jgi:hypothetical protein
MVDAKSEFGTALPIPTCPNCLQLVAQLDSSELMVKTLQSQLADLQKSETILKAKQHHDQVR